MSISRRLVRSLTLLSVSSQTPRHRLGLAGAQETCLPAFGHPKSCIDVGVKNEVALCAGLLHGSPYWQTESNDRRRNDVRDTLKGSMVVPS
jgi:hypothetical protein